MPTKPKRKPRTPDPVRTAKWVVDQATGQIPRSQPPPSLSTETLQEMARDVGLDVEIVPPPKRSD